MKLFTVFLFSLLLVGCMDKRDPAKAAKRPNIVLIVTDDQGWGDLSFNGNSNLETPNLDQPRPPIPSGASLNTKQRELFDHLVALTEQEL